MEDTQLADIGVGSTGPGTIWIDVNLDTDLDLFFGNHAIPVTDLIEDREPTLLLDNRGPLDGFVFAGAQVPDGTNLRREIIVGGSYLSSEDPRAHFGLAGADVVSTATVGWADGASVTRSDVSADQILQADRAVAE